MFQRDGGVSFHSHVFHKFFIFTPFIPILYFLIQWMEDGEGELFGAVPARDITPATGKGILDLVPDDCQASYANTSQVVAVGE